MEDYKFLTFLAIESPITQVIKLLINAIEPLFLLMGP